MIKKPLVLCLMLICTLGLTACSWATLRSTSEMETFISTVYLTNVELVSEHRENRRAEYVFRDENGIEFTIVEVIVDDYFEGLYLGRRSRVLSDYAFRLLDPFINEIRLIFESSGLSFAMMDENHRNTVNIFTSNSSDVFRVEITSFEQISDVVAALENVIHLVPEMPFAITDDNTNNARAPSVEVLIHNRQLARVYFPRTGESVPDLSEVLISIENRMASRYKLGQIDVEIPHDVLMREPPIAFTSVMVGDSDVIARIQQRNIRLVDGQHLILINTFGGERSSFAYIVEALGGSYELIASGHIKWEIAGDIWEAHRISSDRVSVGYGYYVVDTVEVTKNGVVLPVRESPRFTLQDIEMLFGVRAEFTNDVATLYLVRQ